MTTRLTLTQLEELVRSNPELDADEAMEYAAWLVPRPSPWARRRPVWPAGLFRRRHGRKG
jgi:hypothetical protein